MDLQIDRRKARAEQNMAHVMHILRDAIVPDERDSYRLCSQALFKAFYEADVHIIAGEMIR